MVKLTGLNYKFSAVKKFNLYLGFPANSLIFLLYSFDCIVLVCLSSSLMFHSMAAFLVMSLGTSATEEDGELIAKLFGGIGKIWEADKKLFNAIIGLSN
ncbi:Pyrroline-5-carboxylate reductase [Bertholletia excelsa]